MQLNLGAAAGDVDGNGLLNTSDVSAFVGVLLGTDPDPAHQARSDLNCDGRADAMDVRGFVTSYLSP